MRRTESRDALRGDLCVASFVWDADEDGPIPEGVSYLLGAVPEDSVALGGWLQVLLEVDGDFSIYFGEQLLKAVAGPLLVGWHEFDTLLETPPTYFRVDDEPSSRLMISSAAPIVAGQFAVYVFYIHAEATAPDIIGPAPIDELLMDDGAFFVMQDDNSSTILIHT